LAAADLPASEASVTSEASPTDITAAIPEPASLSLLLLGGIPLLGRRRRKARQQ